MRYNDLPRILEDRFPEFREAHPTFDEDASLGPGILMAAFFHFFLSQYRSYESGNEGAQLLLESIFVFLEEAANAADIEVPNVIQVEFMEHMWMASSAEYQAISNRLGPKSRTLLVATEF